MTAARWLLAVAVAVGAIAALIFSVYPELDPLVTSWFYVADYGFPLAQYPQARAISKVLRVASIAVGIGLILLFIRGLLPRWRDHGAESARFVYLITVLIVGPGLIVNALLKEEWGRARPSHTEAFGGDKLFSPPLAISDQCRHNCSFVSGDSAAAFYVVAFGLAFPAWRRRLIGGGLAFGALISLNRVAQGGHYLSDVVFSGVIVVAVSALLYLLLIEHPRFRPKPAKKLQ